MLLALVLALAAARSPAPDGAARRVVEKAVERMGGAEALRPLSRLRVEWVGYRNLLEQSERPDGPWIPSIEKSTEIWDAEGGRWSLISQSTVAEMDFTVTRIVAGDVAANRFGEQWFAAGRGDVDEAREWMSLSPQRTLLAALAAADLRSEPDVVFQGVPHHVVAYGTEDASRRLLLNSETGFPTAVRMRRAYPEDLFWQIWGDVDTEVSWSYWDFFSGGLRYPRQWDVARGGMPWRSLTITKLEALKEWPAGVFEIPETSRESFTGRRSLDDPALGNPKKPAVELSPGVVFVPGSWGVVLVRQNDGVVILEAPISAGYSSRVIEDAARRFPGVPVKAVVTTSDSWPHFGGIREYAARSIPVYVLDRNVPQIQRALGSSHRFHPDALAKTPRGAVLKPVSAKTVLGAGANRLELYPVRGETGERMMLVFLPGSGVLYASDLYQEGRGGPPEYVWEILETARREKLDVRTVVAMHSDPTPWEKLIEIVEAANPSP